MITKTQSFNFGRTTPSKVRANRAKKFEAEIAAQDLSLNELGKRFRHATTKRTKADPSYIAGIANVIAQKAASLIR